ncbi:MAG: N-acetylneuraminate synthase family protein [Planctomycetota bacterium]
MRIGDRTIEAGRAPYVIAEIGVNHDGRLDKALALIELAAKAGADAVKFQHFDASRLMSEDAVLAAYQRTSGESDPIAMLDRLALTTDELARCARCAHKNNVHAIVSVFSTELVGDALRTGWDAFKSASPDVVHRDLLLAMASTGLPLIVSTGASEAAEVERARGWLEPYAERVAFLQCVSSYPAPPEDAHVGAIADIAAIVSPCPIGYSDHTTDTLAGFAAARHGAVILEKHFTDDRSGVGPDHAASLEPSAFAQYVHFATRTAREARDTYFDERLVGDATKRVHDVERDVRRVSRQSLVATRDIAAGETIGGGDLTVKRPGTGIEPWRSGEVVGRRAARDIGADRVVFAEDLA